MSGFFVWSPEGRPPTYLHETLKAAIVERDRLAAEHPGRTFHILAPVLTDEAALHATGYDRGLADGRRQWMDQAMQATLRANTAENQARRFSQRLNRLAVFENKAESFQSIVADCVLWFDGFLGAFAGRDIADQPHVPDRSDLRDLNAAFQRMLRDRGRIEPADLDDEVPF